jgi:hypothetical protein
MSDADSTLRDVLTAVSDLRRDMSSRFDRVDARLDRVDTRLDEHDRRFDEHSRSLHGLTESVRHVWELLGNMNRRHSERFDGLEQQMLRQREEFVALKGHVTSSIGILKDLIEARDFRLDDHGRRLNALETPRPIEP